MINFIITEYKTKLNSSNILKFYFTIKNKIFENLMKQITLYLSYIIIVFFMFGCEPNNNTSGTVNVDKGIVIRYCPTTVFFGPENNSYIEVEVKYEGNDPVAVLTQFCNQNIGIDFDDSKKLIHQCPPVSFNSGEKKKIYFSPSYFTNNWRGRSCGVFTVRASFYPPNAYTLQEDRQTFIVEKSCTSFDLPSTLKEYKTKYYYANNQNIFNNNSYYLSLEQKKKCRMRNRYEVKK